MRQFKADLHIHSRFSRATSSKLTLPLLAAWAKVKGIDVLATGDITQPAWRNELAEQLEFDDNTGLYRLKDNVKLSSALPQFSDRLGLPYPSFILQGEISSIYKKAGKVRKVHNLVYFPNFEAANKFCAKLEQVGNLVSDGRPILGLDCHDLLSMVLESDPNSFLIPAHIWTPWFSLFGAKSGFDSVEDCFEDLSGEIFAMETGLSSDPEMNWTWSALDKYTLVSNSDAHSGENLGREANLFTGVPSYNGIFSSLKKKPAEGCAFAGTVEFFPEEGKYFLDGHRKCNVSLNATEAKECGGICPVCGEPLTEGVSSRILELADRAEPIKPEGAADFVSLIPLAEILGEISGVGAKTQKVARQYSSLVLRYGSELAVLMEVSVGELTRYSPPLGEAITRMRAGKVIRTAGYDGEYGVIRVFSDEELNEIVKGQKLLTGLPSKGKNILSVRSASPSAFSKQRAPEGVSEGVGEEIGGESLGANWQEASNENTGKNTGPALTSKQAPEAPYAVFNKDQQKALEAGPGPVLVLAGPGTGKTKTLVGRILHLINKGVPTKRILAVTFTRRAALEMDKRLKDALGDAPIPTPIPTTDTMHAIAFALWHKVLDAPVLLSEEAAIRTFGDANPDLPFAGLKKVWEAVTIARERMQPCPEEYAAFYDAYFRHKGSWNLVDYTDLLEFWLEQIDNGLFIPPWDHVLVDEVQDFSTLQLTLVSRIVEAAKKKEDLLQRQNAEAAGTAGTAGTTGTAGTAGTTGTGGTFQGGSSLAQRINSHAGDGFFGIGDPNQAIYGFRGAFGEVDAFFRQAWPELQIINLVKNYRSAEDILAASSAVLTQENMRQNYAAQDAAQFSKEAASHAPPTEDAIEDVIEDASKDAIGPIIIAPAQGGSPSNLVAAASGKAGEVRLFEGASSLEEATWIADKILDFLGPTSHTLADQKAASAPLSIFKEASFSPGDIAILVRLSALARPLAKILESRGVPVSVPEEEPFWHNERVKLILHEAGMFLGIAGGPEEESIKCPDGVFAKGPLGLAAYLQDSPPFDKAFWQSKEFNELRRAFDAYDGWAGLINWVNLQTDLELVRSNSEKVQIMTMHASKGLEFPIVFVAGLEDGILPFAGPSFFAGRADKNSCADINEERRLLYVAMTRAEKGLYLSFAAKRTLYGKELRLPASPFLAAIPEELFKRSKSVKHVKHKAQQLSLLK